MSTSTDLELLASRLADEMSAAWRAGRRPPAEEFLARHPELLADPEAAARLVYEEVCSREDLGERVDPAEFVARFPGWRSELEVLLDCHRLLCHSPANEVKFPQVGEVFDGLNLRAELGRGARGRVFLATNPDLGGRRLVLKMTACDGGEHLSLARLQHTHIAPLYWVRDFPERRLRVLCMPYLGGATLSDLLKAVESVPVGHRTGRHLIDALDRTRKGQSDTPPRSPARTLLAGADWADAVCALGVCLAEALHYAHERGLIHLDVKTSNVLVSADGQPLLLDFHLAREPLRPDGDVPECFGGTPDAMSPEQRLAVEAVRLGRPPPLPVDGRSDVYSLGMLLAECLAGPGNESLSRTPLFRRNPRVSVGLSDVVARCLEHDQNRRYATAGEVAADLRRHLGRQPLRGVPNRSLAERWAKWRRRSPHALRHLVLSAVVVAGLIGAGVVGKLTVDGHLTEASASAETGELLLREGKYEAAVTELERGAGLARNAWDGEGLSADIEARLRKAKRAVAAEGLHRVTQRVLFHHDSASLREPALRQVDETCREIWAVRGLLADHQGAGLPPELEERIAADLLDLGTFWAEVRLQQGRPRETLGLLEEVEAVGGPSPVSARLRQSCYQALGDIFAARNAGRQAEALPVRTPGDHMRLGRALLREGQLEPAATHLKQAIRTKPDFFWGHFYHGVCAYRLERLGDAEVSFQVCTALRPEVAECHHNLAQVWAAQGRVEDAVAGYERALDLQPKFAEAALNRGALRCRQRRFDEALADLSRAAQLGANPAAVCYHRALIHLACMRNQAALGELRQALESDAQHRDARKLLDWLEGEGPLSSPGPTPETELNPNSPR